MLKDILPEDVAASILKDVQRRIEVLGEGKANAITTNSDAKMLVAALFYASVLQHGLERGLLNKIADAADHTGSGVSASLKRDSKKYSRKPTPTLLRLFFTAMKMNSKAVCFKTKLLLAHTCARP